WNLSLVWVHPCGPEQRVSSNTLEAHSDHVSAFGAQDLSLIRTRWVLRENRSRSAHGLPTIVRNVNAYTSTRTPPVYGVRLFGRIPIVNVNVLAATAAKPSRLARLTWLPAVLLIGYGVLAASGYSVAPDSYAVSGTADVVVDAE